MAIARGPVDVKRGGRGDGSGKDNPVIHLENGILPWDKQNPESLSVAEVLTECFEGNEAAFLESIWSKVMRTALPASEQVPTFWSIFWTKHPDKLVQGASGSAEKGDLKTAEENTANARKTFAIKVSGLAKTFGANLETFAEEMIARAK